MSKTSTELKSELLGIKFGTAFGRLRKEIMFKLVQDANMDICYRCGEKIKTSKEFSIDHKISWQTHNDPFKTFFDLANISFSHLKCNIIEGGGHNKINAPPGKSWCYSCKNFLDEENFHKRSDRWNGLDYECVLCKSDRMKEYNKSNENK